MSTMTWNDNEGYQEQNAADQNLDTHLAEAERHADRYANGGTAEDGHELDAGERLHELGDATHEFAEGIKGYGNGFSEAVEHEFEGDGTVTGELTEAGVAVGSEVVEAASEAGMEIVSATVDAASSVYQGVGDGIHHGIEAFDKLTDGDLNGALDELGQGAKDLGEGVVDAVGLELKGAVGMAVELGEGALSVGEEIGEGIVEVGQAIGDSEVWNEVEDVAGDVASTVADGAEAVYDGVGDVASGVADVAEGAWDALFGSDDSSSSSSEEEETPEVEEETEDDSWF
jgi:X-X-X-Leu-X-X-Gly heptad repeat protein